jgi:hypothetical protein
MNTPKRGETSGSRQRFAYWLVFIFAVVSLVGVLHHEMWRDELQAWTQARDSSSLADLWRNTRTEPHPMLWYGLLFFLTRFTRDAVAMQCLHWLIAVASVYVFARFSPFTKFQKILFCFSYYPLYEYCAISRDYSLGMVLLFLFCALAQRQPRNYVALASVVGLLSCAHFYDTAIAWALIAVLLFDGVADADERERLRRCGWPAIVAASMVVLCQVLAAAQAWRYARHMPPHDSPGLHLPALSTALAWMWRMFFPIPVIHQGAFGWNTNLWADTSQVGQDLAVVFSGALVILFLVLFWWRSRRAFLLYSLGTLLLLITQTAIGFGPLRHMGKHYLLLVASCWLAARTSPSSCANGLAARAERLLSGLLTAILAIHFVAGGICYGFAFRTVFSAAKPTVQFLRDNHLADKLIAVTPDASASAISGYLGKQVYAADSGRMESFPIGDSTYYAHINKSEDEVVRELLGMLSNATNQIILITRSRLMVPQGQGFQPLETWELPPDQRITRLAEFTETLTDEKFCVYKLEKIPNGLPVSP